MRWYLCSLGKRVGCFILSILCASFASASLPNGPVEYEKMAVIYHTHEIEVNLEIPVLTYTEDEVIQDAINTMFESHATAFVKEVYSWYPEHAQMAEEHDFEPHAFVAYTRFEVAFNESRILSIPVTYYQYTGGAHGMTEIRSYNIDLRTGELFKLNEILNNQQIAAINEEIERQLQEDSENFFPEAAQDFEGVADDQHFYLENGTLVIYFDLYELRPYALGIPEFRFSLDSLDLTIEGIKELLSQIEVSECDF